MKITAETSGAFDLVLVDNRNGYAPRPVMCSFLAAAVTCGKKPDHWVLHSDVSGEVSTWSIVALVNGFIIHTTATAQQGNWTFSEFDQNLPPGHRPTHPENNTTTKIWPAHRVRGVRVSSAEYLDGWRGDGDEIAASWELILDNDRSIEIRPRTKTDHKAGEGLVHAVLATIR